MSTTNCNLAQFFPIIREKNLILNDINSNPALSTIFYSWRQDQQDDFLSICTGTKGVKMLYDSYFKEILSPELPKGFQRVQRLLHPHLYDILRYRIGAEYATEFYLHTN